MADKKQIQHKKISKNRPVKPAQKSRTKFPFVLAGMAAIILTAIIAYYNSFACGYHFDDFLNITKNPAIRSLADVSAWWNFVPSRPLGTLTFALNYYFNGIDVWGYHFVNLVIHISNALLFFWMTRLIFVTPALRTEGISKYKDIISLAAALLFVSHPVETQAVTYIVQRLASLVTFFYLLTICLYIKARIADIPKTHKNLLFTFTGVSAILAFLTKENSYTLPLMILLVEFFFIRQRRIMINFKDWKLWIVAAAVMAIGIYVFSNFSFSVFKTIQPEQGNTYTLTSGTYLLTQFRVIVTYIRLLLMPVHQNLDYDYTISQSLFELKTFVSFLLLAGLFIYGILFYKKHRLLSFGIFWFFITLLVESSFIPIVNVIFEHRVYLPSVGFFIVLCSLPYYFLKPSYTRIISAILLLIVPVLIFATISRNMVWKDEYTLWQNVLENSPNKSRPLNNYGNALHDAGKSKEALPYFDRAIANNPLYEIAFYNRGNTKYSLGNYAGAIGDYTQAIALCRNFPEPYIKRALTRKSLKDFKGAILDFDTAIQIVPQYTMAYSERGLAKKEMGDIAGALTDFQKAISLYPDFPDPYNYRGVLKRDKGDFSGAIEDFSTAIRLFPKDPGAYNNRGMAKAMMNNLQGALDDFNQALKLDPKFVESYNNRANTKAALKDFAGSIEDYTRSLELNPNNDLAMCNRGLSKYSLKDFDGACSDWQHAAQMGNSQAISFFIQVCLKK